MLNAEDIFETEALINEKLQLLGAATRCMMMAGALESVLEMSVQYSLETLAIRSANCKVPGYPAAVGDTGGRGCRQHDGQPCNLHVFPRAETTLILPLQKARIGESVSVCTEIAHQVHGAMGFTREHSLNYRTRRLWCWREEYGNERFLAAAGRSTIHSGWCG